MMLKSLMNDIHYAPANVYGRHGEGSRLCIQQGKEIYRLVVGIAVNALAIQTMRAERTGRGAWACTAIVDNRDESVLHQEKID